MRLTCPHFPDGFNVRQIPSRECCVLMMIVLLWPAGSNAAPPGTKSPTTDYTIVVTGGELLKGVYADGHTHFLTRTLAPLGLRCIGSMSVDDQPNDIKEALRFATDRTDLVFVTGGLGPTDSDRTRQTLASFTGITLREHPDVVGELERRYKTPREKLSSGLRRQTLVPSEGTYLSNPHGTAVGLVFETADSVIVALPGPPRELQPMVRDALVKYLDQRFELRPAGCSLTLRFVGIGQSRIQQTLKAQVLLPPATVPSSQFNRGRVDFTFSLPDDTPGNREKLQKLKRQILHHLSDYVYATDKSSLEDHIVRLLESRGQTLTIAEVGSGGSLTSGLSSAIGAEDVLSGAFVAPTEEKLRTLLGVPDDEPTANTSSAQAAEQLAAAAASLAGRQWICAIGKAQQDESGSHFVHVAVRSPNARTETARIRLRTDDTRHARLVTQLLDHLRRQLN